jgi:hypothetical protein
MRLGEYVADHGMEGDGKHRAVRDLLMGVAPRLRGQAFKIAGEKTSPQPFEPRSISSKASFRCRGRPVPARLTRALV